MHVVPALHLKDSAVIVNITPRHDSRNTIPLLYTNPSKPLKPKMSIGLIAILLSLCNAREITFPPVAGIAPQQVFPQIDIDISTGSAFAGLTTYANLPYAHCLAPEKEDVKPYDIAILGAPFDTVRSDFPQWSTIASHNELILTVL